MAEEIKRSEGRYLVRSFCFLEQDTDPKLDVNRILDMRDEHIELVRNAPKGGELYERIRKRSLNE